MIDKRFYSDAIPISVSSIVDLIGGRKHRGSDQLMAHHVAPCDRVEAGGLCFANNKAAASMVKDEEGVICLTTSELADEIGQHVAVILAPEPKHAFSTVLKAMFPQEDITAHIDPKALIAETAIIGEGCRIEAGAFIGDNVEIGKGCHIKSGARIEKGCIIGPNCRIGANTSIAYAIIGADNHFDPGCQIGIAGFGVSNDDGNMIIPHLGRVIIGSRNYISAGTCIDRGFLDDTIIGDNFMCDNLVHIAHNCRIGDGNIMCAQVGIAGSVTIGDNNIFGGKVGVGDHLTIGSDNVFSGYSRINKSVGDGCVLAGIPATSLQNYKKDVATLRRLIAKHQSSR